MPRTLPDALGFVAGFWLALTLILPIGAPWASAENPGLALLESRLTVSVNAFRRSQHLIPLERRAELDEVARAHSEDMARRGFFAHESPEGHDWVDRLAQFQVSGFRMAAENVGQTSRGNPNQEILEGWKHSTVHLDNLVSRPMNATGVGIARAPDGRLFYTQLYLNYPR